MKRALIAVAGSIVAICIIVLGIFLLVDRDKQGSFSDEKPLAIKGQAFLAISFTQEEAEMYKTSLKENLKEAIEDTEKEISDCDSEEQANDLKQRLESLQKTDIDEMFEPQGDESIEMKIPHSNAEIIIDGTNYQTDAEGYYSIRNEEKIESIIRGETEVVFVSHGAEIAKTKVLFDKNKDNNEIKCKKTFMEFAEGAANM